jgi:hypothetical protein
MDVSAMKQQLDRVRNPISINLYCENHMVKPYTSMNDKEIITSTDKVVITATFKTIKYKEELDILKYLYKYEKYKKSYYGNTIYYLCKLLRDKGYHNFDFNPMYDSGTNLSKKEYDEILTKEIEENKIDDKLRDDIIDKYKCFGFTLTDLCNLNKDSQKDILMKLLPIVLDNGKTRNLLNYMKFKYEKYKHCKLIVDKKENTKQTKYKFLFEKEDTSIMNINKNYYDYD